MIEKGRQKGIPRELRICKSCDLGCVEDEYHFVIICPAYENLRKKFTQTNFKIYIKFDTQKANGEQRSGNK